MNFHKGTKEVPAAVIAGEKRDKKRVRTAVLIVFALIIISQNCFLPVAYTVPFPPVPEKFVYDLQWTGITAGRASLELRDDGDRLKILSVAQSASWVSVFYTVEDRVESTLLKNLPGNYFQLSQYRLKIREGRHRRDKEVIFDHDTNKAIYIDHLKNEKHAVQITPPVFDPLAGFYYLRSLELRVGQPVYITIFDSQKVWNVEVQVLRKERIALPAGMINTIVVKPLMKSEGIFSRKGEIFIWLTDDNKHIPVKMQTKVAIGSITATLIQGLY